MLRGALVGCGYIAPRHVKAWSTVPNGELVAVCDLDLARARGFSEASGIPNYFESLDALISAMSSELDFIDISVPPEFHREMVEKALEHDLSVLCQKPMAETRKDSLAIVHMASETSRAVAINEMWKWIPAYEQAGRYIHEGMLGDIAGVRFAGLSNLLLPRRGGQAFPDIVDKPSEQARAVLLERFGVMSELIIMEYGVHVLDMLRTWFGEPQGLTSVTSRVNPAVVGDDGASIRLRFEGFEADVWIDWSSPGFETGDIIDGESLTILGSEGLLTVTAGKWFEWHPHDGATVRELHPEDTRDAGFARSHANFADCAESGARPVSDPADNLRSQSLMLACYASAAQSGTWIESPSEFVFT